MRWCPRWATPHGCVRPLDWAAAKKKKVPARRVPAVVGHGRIVRNGLPSAAAAIGTFFGRCAGCRRRRPRRPRRHPSPRGRPPARARAPPAAAAPRPRRAAGGLVARRPRRRGGGSHTLAAPAAPAWPPLPAQRARHPRQTRSRRGARASRRRCARTAPTPPRGRGGGLVQCRSRSPPALPVPAPVPLVRCASPRGWQWDHPSDG